MYPIFENLFCSLFETHRCVDLTLMYVKLGGQNIGNTYQQKSNTDYNLQSELQFNQCLPGIMSTKTDHYGLHKDTVGLIAEPLL